MASLHVLEGRFPLALRCHHGLFLYCRFKRRGSKRLYERQPCPVDGNGEITLSKAEEVETAGGVERMCPCGLAHSIPGQILPTQSRTMIFPVPVQTSFCVGGKKENKSLINVCYVVDDFVTTSVANGLCMRNNGLLAEREIA